MVLLESENDSRIILDQETLGVSADNRSLYLIDLIDWRVQYLRDGRCLSTFLFDEFDKFATSA